MELCLLGMLGPACKLRFAFGAGHQQESKWNNYVYTVYHVTAKPEHFLIKLRQRQDDLRCGLHTLRISIAARTTLSLLSTIFIPFTPFINIFLLNGTKFLHIKWFKFDVAIFVLPAVSALPLTVSLLIEWKQNCLSVCRFGTRYF